MPDLDLNKIMEMAQNAQAELQKATESLDTSKWKVLPAVDS